MPSKKEMICKVLYESIVSGKYPDSRLPTERQLAKSFGVALGTMQSALRELQKRDLIERIRSQGTFVKAGAGKGKRRILYIVNLTPFITNPFLYIQNGIVSEAERSDAELIMIDFRQVKEMSPSEFNAAFGGEDISGLLLSMDKPHADRYLFWQEFPKPTIFTHAYTSSPVFAKNIAAVRIDTVDGMRKGLRYLCECGHKHIAGIIPKARNLRGMSEMEYFRLLGNAGADCRPELLRATLSGKEALGRNVDELFRLPDPPTAIWCFSDYFAMQLCDVLKERNLRIPLDVSVLGMSGYPGSEFFSPSLSTVDYNYFECGVQAVRYICNPDKRNGDIVIPCTLIKRTSTAVSRTLIPEEEGMNTFEYLPLQA